MPLRRAVYQKTRVISPCWRCTPATPRPARAGSPCWPRQTWEGKCGLAVATRLHSQDPKERLHAAEALRIPASADALDALLGALRDQDADVRENLASRLVELTGHSVVEPEQPAPSAIQLENLWCLVAQPSSRYNAHRVSADPLPDAVGIKPAMENSSLAESRIIE